MGVACTLPVLVVHHHKTSCPPSEKASSTTTRYCEQETWTDRFETEGLLYRYHRPLNHVPPWQRSKARTRKV
jgi:hypothetical protein